MTAEKAYLLHLVAKTYPGTRPSEIYGLKTAENPDGLDELQAWEFDSSLAYRHSMKDRDAAMADLHEIVQAIRLTGNYHGLKKKIKYEKYKTNIPNLVTIDEDAEEQQAKEDPLLIKLTKGSKIDHVTISRDNLQHP